MPSSAAGATGVPGAPTAPTATAADRATAMLFDAICDGSLAPGARLRLTSLAEQLQMSAMPVREAIRRLEAMALVEHVPHRGARVAELSAEDLEHTYAARLLLEGQAVFLAASRIDDETAARARGHLAEREAALATHDRHAARDAHEAFHFALYDACGNPWLVRSILPLWRNAERYRLISLRDPEATARRTTEHHAVLDAIVAGDGDGARSALEGHLTASLQLARSAIA